VHYSMKYFGAIVYKYRFALLLLAILNFNGIYQFLGVIGEKTLTILLFVILLYSVSRIGEISRRADTLENNLAGEGDQGYRPEGENHPAIRSHGH
jgi:hypothetical protein